MTSRRFMMVLVTAIASGSLLIALHRGHPVEIDAQPESSEPQRPADAATPMPASSATQPSKNRRLSGSHPVSDSRAPDDATTIHARSSIDSTGTVQSSAAPRVLETNAGVDSSSDPPTPSDSKPQRPTFWQTDNAGEYLLATDHEKVHTGSSSADIQSSSPESKPNSATAVFQACSAADFRGKRARFTIYLLGDDGFGSAEVWLRVDDPTNSMNPIGVVRQAATLTGTSDWTPASAEIDVSPTARVLVYGVILHGPGPLRLDTAQLDIVDPDGTMRPEPVRDPTADEMLMNTSPVLRYPQNLDFEGYYTAP